MRKEQFLHGQINNSVLILNIITAIAYFLVVAFVLGRGQIGLFIVLVIGELFHLWQILTYIYTVWNVDYMPSPNRNYLPPVDVFITVAGEPVEIVARTCLAAKRMNYPNFRIHILNDGYAAGKENWHEVVLLAQQLGINCITREKNTGAKAGNINNALQQTFHPFVAVFDADHVPYPDFLAETMGYFYDLQVGFVQTPQYYENKDANLITIGAWDQQALFFGPILRGKNRLNSVFMCGTNMVIRRATLEDVGGMCEDNIAEDFLTSLFIHEHGWKSVYVPKILAEGLAPEDFLSYYKQQFRWARGSLEVIFKFNPLLRWGMSLKQKIQYLASASFYLSGLVVLLNAITPLLYLFLGMAPIRDTSMSLAIVFLPYIITSLFVIQSSANFRFSLIAVSFSLSSFVIYLKALWSVLTGQKVKFEITSKTKLSGSFLRLVRPHLLYILLIIIGTYIGIMREGITASVLVNVSWALLNTVFFIPFILAASKKGSDIRTEQLTPMYELNKV